MSHGYTVEGYGCRKTAREKTYAVGAFRRRLPVDHEMSSPDVWRSTAIHVVKCTVSRQGTSV